MPLEVTTVKDGKPSVDHKAVLENRETTYPIKDVSNAIYKLNSGSAGVCKLHGMMSLLCFGELTRLIRPCELPTRAPC